MKKNLLTIFKEMTSDRYVTLWVGSLHLLRFIILLNYHDSSYAIYLVFSWGLQLDKFIEAIGEHRLHLENQLIITPKFLPTIVKLWLMLFWSTLTT